MTELQQKAIEAWYAMLHPVEPMPPAFALDMVQDATGERAEAATELFAAAVRWLELKRPADDLTSANSMAAIACAAHMQSAAWSLAEGNVKDVRERSHEQRLAFVLRGRVDSAGAKTARGWCYWCDYAADALSICRELDQLSRTA